MGNGYSVLFDAAKTHIERKRPSEIAEAYRVLSTGNFPGKFSFELSPWARAIVDCLMPECPYRTIAIMKSSQIGFTVAVLANLILAVFKQYHADMLFMSDDDTNVKRAMEGFIDDMIRESGIGDTLGKSKSVVSKHSNTGNTSQEKKFNRGRNTLWTWSGQVVGKLSSITPKYSFNDEVERWKRVNKRGGDPYSLVMNRHKTFPVDAKAFFGSSPELEGSSIIQDLFLQGDQNHYHIPCPHCGEYIDLHFSINLDGKTAAGIYYKRDTMGNSIPKEVGYVCQKCGGYFKESHKYQMYKEDTLSHAKGAGPVCLWIPKNPNANKKDGSFHISALYAGAGLHSWANIVDGWCKAHPVGGNVIKEKLHTIINQEFGLPFREMSRQLSAKGMMRNCRFYDIGTIPDILSETDGNGQIVLITLTADLNGRMGDTVEEDDVRLDYEVIAWCEKGSGNYVPSYSIEHGSIGTFERNKDRAKRMLRGDTRVYDKYTYRHGVENSVWTELEKIRTASYPTQSGDKRKINISAIDSGNWTSYVEEYAATSETILLIKGAAEEKYTGLKTKGKCYEKGGIAKLYLVKGNQLKDELVEEMSLDWRAESGLPQPDGFMNFPNPENGLYGFKSFFSQFENEERKLRLNTIGEPVGFRWQKKHTQAEQHFFDVRLYGRALREIIMNEYCHNSNIDISWSNFVKLISFRLKKVNLPNKS